MWKKNKTENYKKNAATTDVRFMLHLGVNSMFQLCFPGGRSHNFTEHKLLAASGRTRRCIDSLLGHQKQEKYPINSAHIQHTSGVSKEAPFYFEQR